ncbi:MAG: hypothetical protein IJE83_02550, partial [Oscillospiraceae bacterium]|nr:hypothetical protein [Oscillospiraceae bacterium]
MFKNKIRIYCALLAAVLLAVTAKISVAPAYARYENAVYTKTVYESKEKITKSDCLAPAEEQMSILLGEMDFMEKEKIVSFTLASFGRAEKGKLYWSVAGDEYIDVSVSYEGTNISNDAEIELSADVVKNFEMKITQDMNAEIPAEDTEVSVKVSWSSENGTLYGDFQMTVPGNGGNEITTDDSSSEGSGVVTETITESTEPLSSSVAEENNGENTSVTEEAQNTENTEETEN